MKNFRRLSDPEKKLDALTKKARALLVRKRGEYDRADIALLDMAVKAEAALVGKKFPFTCQRQFWQSTDADEIAELCEKK